MNVAATVVGKLIGSDSVLDLSAFVQAFDPVMNGFRQRAERTRATLASPRSGFVVVATPDKAALAEARYFSDRLAREGLPLLGAIVNQRVVAPAGVSVEDARRLLPQTAQGSAERFALEETIRLQEVAARQARLIRRYIGPGLPAREVPRLDGELVDVEQLRGLARAIGA
jgi:anion-transporting  ArsA/GET3 family ATPase